jgi:hypothetical protein
MINWLLGGYRSLVSLYDLSPNCVNDVCSVMFL